jgi:hypothetical protein
MVATSPRAQIPFKDKNLKGVSDDDGRRDLFDAVKKKRVFEDGYCWRCAERPGGSDDLGLCDVCRTDLRLSHPLLVA